MRFPLATLASLVTLFGLALSSDTDPNANLANGQAACRVLRESSLRSKYASATVQPLTYTSSRDYWNSRNNLYAPACVIYPTTADEVSTALRAIKAAGSRFAVKAGGHNPNNFFSSVDKGVLIDLEDMNQRSFDAANELITYGPGGTFGDIYKWAAQFGRTVVGARLGGVGTGLGLGGGLSYLSNQYGMAVDGFRSLQVVLPNGDIVTASSTENPELFFVMKGGGGNAYGIVTAYTVAARTPSPMVTSGILIIPLNFTERLRQASYNFAARNTDPKAAIITTWEEFPIPDLNIGLSQFALVFLVYDGTQPGDVFKEFFDIPAIINTFGPKTYEQTVNDLVPGSTQFSKARNTFRVSVGEVTTNMTFSQAFDSWKSWSSRHKLDGSYLISSLAFEPVPKSLTDASKAQGGNAMNMPDGPYYWLCWTLTVPPLTTPARFAQIQATFRAAQEAATNTPGLPLFINDAAFDQNPLQSFSTYPRLKAAKQRFDPDNFFADFTGGWAFP